MVKRQGGRVGILAIEYETGLGVDILEDKVWFFSPLS